MKKPEILESDPVLRLIYAFNNFAKNNPAWEDESTVSRKNRNIERKLTGEAMANDYFTYGKRFYAVNYEMQENGMIECEIQEYDKFYEMADEFLCMRFAFNPTTRLLERLDSVVRIPNLIRDDKYQKILNVA